MGSVASLGKRSSLGDHAASDVPVVELLFRILKDLMMMGFEPGTTELNSSQCMPSVDMQRAGISNKIYPLLGLGGTYNCRPL